MTVINNTKNSDNCVHRKVHFSGNACVSDSISQLVDDIRRESVCHSVIAWQKFILFSKPFTASTAISFLFNMNENILAKGRNILDNLLTIVVDCVCQFATARTFMFLTLKFAMYVNSVLIFFNFFY